jgi:hypothetical protein
MSANTRFLTVASEPLLTELTSVALEVLRPYTPGGVRAETAYALHAALGERLGDARPVDAADLGLERERMLARFAEAAYRVALAAGLRGNFAEAEVRLWNAFRLNTWQLTEEILASLEAKPLNRISGYFKPVSVRPPAN